MSEPTEPPAEPKTDPEPRAADEPKPPEKPKLLDITDEEWIAASQACCGRKE